MLVRLHGPAVEALLNINGAKYKDFVTKEKGVKVIYVQLLKAMYGTITAPLLCYNIFADSLIKMDFEINPYDLCVANKMVDGSQMTICWYVDDLKISHTNEERVNEVVAKIESQFGKMNVVHGNKHTYLGMDVQIEDRKVSIEMPEYLGECIIAFGEPINSVATSPATRMLHTINPEAEALSVTKRETFHHIVAKLLHVAKRARLDIQPTVIFLCRRVKNPTVEDWGKLKRLLQYIKGTLKMKRILSLTNLSEWAVYVDAAHATHEDFRGHTGGCVKMGDGVMHSISKRQNINTKSSTETELVGASDYLPYFIWLVYFMRHQGYVPERKVLFQDNQSTMKLLKNGRKSAGTRSRHINIRYFWITDVLKRRKLK